MSSVTCVISIGRNMGRRPMNADLWFDFKSEVTRAAQQYGTLLMRPTVSYGSPSSQRGVWDNEMEECAVWMLRSHNEMVESQLGIQLSALAADYRQACIGFICHRGTTLVPRS